VVTVDAKHKTHAKVAITLQTRHVDRIAETISDNGLSADVHPPPAPALPPPAAAAAPTEAAPPINGIAFLEVPGVGTEVYACLDDGSVFMWRRAVGASMTAWTAIGRLPTSASTASATAPASATATATAVTITATLTSSGIGSAAEVIVASSNSHGAIHIWRRPLVTVTHISKETTLGPADSFAASGLQIIQFARASTPHSLHLMTFDTSDSSRGNSDSSCSDWDGHAPSSALLLAGSVDSRVHIATAAAGQPFGVVGTLPGHDEWVTCIASQAIPSTSVVAAGASSSGSSTGTGTGTGSDKDRDRSYRTMVATGSKDFKVRVWRFQASYNSASSVRHSGVPSGAQPAVIEVDDGEDGEDLEDDTQAAGAGSGGGTGAAGNGYVVDEDDLIGAHEARLVFSLPEGVESGAGLWSCAIYLETLLVGHEDWISSLVWLPSSLSAHSLPSDGSTDAGAAIGNTLQLFSTSMDRNMILWEGASSTTTNANNTVATSARDIAPQLPTEAAGIWLPVCRIGDVGGMLGGSVGGNLLGFTAACMSADGRAILGIGYGGSFHLYVRQAAPHQSNLNAGTDCSNSNSNSMSSVSSYRAKDRWIAQPFLTGHFDAVTDLCWASDGSYLVSVSSDQSTRLWSVVTHTESAGSNSFSESGISAGGGRGGYEGNWAEISRPQIHGYNLSCLALSPKTDIDTIAKKPSPLKLSVTAATAGTNVTATVVTEILDTSYLLYSAGDEKMIRVFDAPEVVLDGLSTLCGREREGVSSGADVASAASIASNLRIKNAYIPELGLTNRAAHMMSGAEKAEQLSRGTCDMSWASGLPPLEGQLADMTVWPEVKKLFGHTNEIVCMALSVEGAYLATACKARNAQTAAILLWDTSTMAIVGTLLGHDSTVSCLAFSPDGQFLASSGKDRSLCLYEKCNSAENESPYLPYIVQKGSHKRIVWDLSWTSALPSPRTANTLDTATSSNTFLLSGSRDGACKLWQVICGLSVDTRAGQALTCLYSFLPFGGVSVTAVQFRWPQHSPINSASDDIVLRAVVGSELGDIRIWDLAAVTVRATDRNGEEPQTSVTGECTVSITHTASHGAAVKRMKFGGPLNDLLATCGSDNTVRIFKFT